MKNPKVSICTKSMWLRVYFDGLLHIAVPQKGLSIQSYKQGRDFFIIEYYTKMGVVKSEYNDITKWSAILKLLDTL